MKTKTISGFRLSQPTKTKLISVAFESMMRGFKLHPYTWKWWREVNIHKNISYGPEPEHRLDIYQPKLMPSKSPVCMYIHGGAFTLLSKDTHWMAALHLARQGYTVFTIDYRLAREAPFPAAVQDSFAAAQWIYRNASTYGADHQQMVIGGESAGGNLTLGVAVASCFAINEPWAKALYSENLPIKAVFPICGFLQTSNPERYVNKDKLPQFFKDRIAATSIRYTQGKKHPLADPLVIIESDRQASRPLPPIYSFVGTKDPILDDTRRLERALKRRDTAHEVLYYPNEVHGFHLAVWRQQSQIAWRKQEAYLRNYVQFSR